MSFADWKKRSKQFTDLYGRFGQSHLGAIETACQAAYKAGERQGRKDADMTERLGSFNKGVSMEKQLEIGKEYLVRSQRKGTFMARITRVDETWATCLITGGHAKAMMEYNERDNGEEVTVRRSLCSFIEQPPNVEVSGGAKEVEESAAGIPSARL